LGGNSPSGNGKKLLERAWDALMVEWMYGSGLPVKECCRLRVKDMDLERLQLAVRVGRHPPRPPPPCRLASFEK
jgi:integrase